MEENNELDLTFDPSRDEVLGVFGKYIHIKCDKYVLIMTKSLYHKIWKQWIKGKQDYCELYNHYCGVMGYTFAKKFKKVESITLNIWSESDEDMREVLFDAYLVKEFDDYCDFEHG